MATRIHTRNGNGFLASRRTAAFSLVEVLVVLVVLLVGILSILRLFPGGFLTIQRTGEISNAQALSSQQLDAQKEKLALPEAIAADPRFVNGAWTFNSDIAPDDLSEGLNAALQPDPFYSDINHFRYVVGESFRVPVYSPNSQTGAIGATYMLSQGPVVNQFDGKEYVNVHSAPMERTERTYNSSTEGLEFALREGQYAIDYQSLKIAFNPRVSGDNTRFRLFNLSFDYYVSTANGVSVQSTSVALQVNDVLPSPDSAQPQWVNIFNTPPTGFLGFVYGSDTCSRKFKLVMSNGPYNNPASQSSPWSSDPFEYAWFSGQEEGGSANVGVLVFNPIGHDYLVQTATGTQPLIAVVDYATFDNHILREDRTLPGSGPFEVRTSVPFIRLNGDVLNDGTTYKGLFGGNVNSADILVYNAQTGRELGEINGGQVTAANADLTQPNGSDPSVSVDDANAAFAVEQRTGILRFSQSFITTNNLQSQTIRILYKANRDWGMQLQKAAAHYDEVGDKNSVSYHLFYVGPPSPPSSTRIYFAKCDIGKTVILGRFTIDETNGGSTSTNTYTNETYQIHDVDTAGGDNVGKPYIDVKEQHPNATQFNSNLTGRAVENVQGGSIKSRVIWNNGAQRYTDGTGTQRLNTRWRKVDNDTFLLQNLSR